MKQTPTLLPRWKRPQSWIVLVLVAGTALWLVLLLSYSQVSRYASPYLFDQTSQVPHAKIGLVLGTAKKIEGIRYSHYFLYRMEAAARLYRAKKVKLLLVSGNSTSPGARETKDMRAYLIKLGIPGNRILSDPKGMRTFDSIVRCQKLFQQTKFIVVSQAFHNERAIFLARKMGLVAFGYNAKDVKDSRYQVWKEAAREHLARVKAWLDLYVLGTKPQYAK